MADPFRDPATEAASQLRDVERENRQFRFRWDITRFPHTIADADRDDAIPAREPCAAGWCLEADELVMVDYF